MMLEEKFYRDRVLWLALASGAFFLLPTLWFRFTMDQALCNYSAWVWKTYHLPPYIGVWDLSFPGIFILHRIVMGIFGQSIFGFRLFDFMVQLSSAGMIYYLTKRLSGSRSAGFLSSVFYCIYYAGLGSLETGEREGYVFWILLVSLILNLRIKKRKLLLKALVGLLLGFAFLLKPTYGLAWVVFGIWFFIESRGERFLTVVCRLGLYAFFCIIPSLLVILYYWRLGYLIDLWQATIIYNFEVYTGSTTANLANMSRLHLIFYILHKDYIHQSLIIFSAFIMLLFYFFNREMVKDIKLFWILIALISIGLLSYRVQAKYFPYHLIPAMGFLSIFSGACLSWIALQLKGQTTGLRDKFVHFGFYFALFVIMLTGVNWEWINYFAYESFKPFDRAYASGSTFDAQYYQTAKDLEPILRREEIAYFGWHPVLPYILQKKLPSRFCVVYHLLIRRADGNLSELQKKWIREYTDDVIKAKPKFFLVADYVPGWDIFNLKNPSLKQAMSEQFPELEKFLKDNYQLLRKNSLIEVYVYFGKSSEQNDVR